MLLFALWVDFMQDKELLQLEIFKVLFNIWEDLHGPITQLANVSNMLQAMIAACERVFEFLEEEEEIPDTKNPHSVEDVKGNVTFEHVKLSLIHISEPTRRP